MAVDSAKREFCPRQEDHDQHFWIWSDENGDEKAVKSCPGLTTITVDIFERGYNGA